MELWWVLKDSCDFNYIASISYYSRYHTQLSKARNVFWALHDGEKSANLLSQTLLSVLCRWIFFTKPYIGPAYSVSYNVLIWTQKKPTLPPSYIERKLYLQTYKSWSKEYSRSSQTLKSRKSSPRLEIISYRQPIYSTILTLLQSSPTTPCTVSR